ncbi:MAG: type II toxin-antitoxin system VapC family toxin [Sphingomonas sp.]|nr:type II toxin-antitoxin system VapC family toxin [Sphingomonas sp.]
MLVRALVLDDAAQSRAAQTVLEAPWVLLASVLLETEWVLRSTYRWPRDRIADAFEQVLDLPTLAQAPLHAGWAVTRYRAGADFSDLIHLALAPPAERLVTFDRRLARAAGPDTPVQIETFS